MSTFLITGANRGIGFALAQHCLNRGDTVFATARDVSAASFAALQGRHGSRLIVVPLDVADAGSVDALADHLGGRPVDVLVNNAGVIGPERQATLDMDFEGLLHTLTVNTLGPLRVTQKVLPHLMLTDTPKIATTSSLMGSMSHAKSDKIAYRASKAAVNKIMQGLATDLEPRGVAVVTLHLGWVRTEMGGQEADIDVNESARGVLAVIDALSLETTGRFMNYDGSRLSW